MSEEKQQKWIDKLKILGANIKYNKYNQGYNIIIASYNDNTADIYVLSERKIVVYPRNAFRNCEIDAVNLSESKLYSHNLSNTFFGSNIKNLALEDVESAVPEGISKIFNNFNTGCKIKSSNQILFDVIRAYERGDV